MNDEQKETLLRQLQNPTVDYLKRKLIYKKIVELSKKNKICGVCGFANGLLKASSSFFSVGLFFTGVVKKAVGAVLKIVHAEPITEEALIDFENVRREHKELSAMIPASKSNLLDPLKVLGIFRKIADSVGF